MLVGIAHVIDDRVLHLFLDMGRFGTQLRHTINDIDHEVEARGLVQHRQLERRVDVALFLIAAHMHILVSFESIGQLVNQPGIAVKIEDDRLVRAEKAAELTVRQAVWVFGGRLELEQIHNIDEAQL